MKELILLAITGLATKEVFDTTETLRRYQQKEEFCATIESILVSRN